jgi:hypothetical protein
LPGEQHRNLISASKGKALSGRTVTMPSLLSPESIAVGSHAFVKEIKNKLAVKTVGRKMRDIIDGFELREPEFSYNALFEAKKEDIGQNRGPN